jgi:acetyl-CoA C-acetyltransferase
MPQGTQGKNMARQCALAGGLAVTTPGMTVDRQCSSGMMAIATVAKSIMAGEIDIAVAGGVESVSLVQNSHMNMHRAIAPDLVAMHEHIYMPMIDTAEVVAKRYGISREAQDSYALQSQQRTAKAQDAGKLDDEIVAMPSTMAIKIVIRVTSVIKNFYSKKIKVTGHRPHWRVCLRYSRCARTDSLLRAMPVSYLTELRPVW